MQVHIHKNNICVTMISTGPLQVIVENKKGTWKKTEIAMNIAMEYPHFQ